MATPDSTDGEEQTETAEISDVSAAPNRAFPIVAVGASAGGLKALLALFGALPAATGMAFIVLQHLEPSARSALPDLLGRVTRLPVMEAQDRMALQPDHVYTVPASADATLAAGAIQLSARTPPQGGSPHMPIDRLFTSLAHEKAHTIVGVVLSGTGADGSQGLREIRGAGGIGYAQAPESAEFGGMPQAAAAAGADAVLPPEEIAAALGRMAGTGASLRGFLRSAAEEPERRDGTAPSAPEEPLAPAEVFPAILAALRSATGQDFSNYRTGTVWRRIQRRMILRNQSQPAAYLLDLRRQPEEARALGQDLLINVTSFFRNPEVFEALKMEVFPQLPYRHRAEAAAGLRLWVAGCSSGEEVYSLAIALLEFLDRRSPAPLQIFGTDLDGEVLERARAGVYSEAEMAPVSAERRKRFFTRQNGGFRISKNVRELCLFSRHDLCTDPPFSRMDLVSCRNLLIYFNPATQRRALGRLYYALRPGGFLLLGASESTGQQKALFSALNPNWKIYAKSAAVPVSAWAPELVSQARTAPDPAHGSHSQSDLDQMLLAHYTGAALLVNGRLEILQTRGDTGPYLQLPPGKADLNLLRMARAELQAPLRAALAQAKRDRAAASQAGVRLRSQPREAVRIEVIPGQTESPEAIWLVLLHSEPAPLAGTVSAPPHAGARRSARERELAELQQQLLAAQDQAQAANEQFQSIQEELQSSNEELQSSNEELETSKEEIQSSNEELTTLADELRRHNTELAQLNDDLANLLATVAIPILFVDNDLRIRRFTPTATQALRIAPGDIDRPVTDLTLNLDLPDFELLLLAAIHHGTTSVREARDASDRWHKVTVRPYLGSGRRAEGAIAALEDIDALKRSEQSHQMAEEFGRAIMLALREPLLVLSPSLEIQFANHAFHQHFHLPGENVTGRLLDGLGGGEWSSPELRRMLLEVGRGGAAVHGWSWEQNFLAIGQRALLLNAERISQSAERAPFILLAIEDVTDRRRAELVRVAAATGRMAATLAHEINNPLGALANIMYVLARTPLEPQARDLVRSAGEEVDRILHIARQALGLYGRPKPEAVAIAPLLDQILETFAVRIQEQGVAIERRYADGAAVLAGAVETRQIFTNLIENAIAAVGRGGKIILHILPGGGSPPARVTVAVADNGPGIPAENRSQIFDPFFSTKDRRGTGLGLWVAQSMALKYGGEIRLRSTTRPGRHGTAFFVFLPAAGDGK